MYKCFCLSKALKNVNGVSKVSVARYLSDASQKKNVWDIVISGGGLVGCSLACALGSSPLMSGKRILLLESGKKIEYIIQPNKYSNRVCAISPGSRDLFESFGAWEKIRSIRAHEVKKMQVWESCSDAKAIFQYPNMTDSVAYIVENDVMLKAFNERLSELENSVQVMRGVKAVNYKLPDIYKLEKPNVEILLENGQTITTRLLIGADGINSLIRDKMEINYIKWSYNQKGIVATLKLAEPTENVVAWQRFLESGPIALLPLSDDTCSLVWTVSHPMCDKLLKSTDEEFIDSLNHHLWDHSKKMPSVDSLVNSLNSFLSTVFEEQKSVQQLPPCILSVEPNSRAAFPLGLGHASQYVSHRIALIGDAAHRVHPLAGQGVNLGFGDVKCLVECLEDSIYRGNSIDSVEPLWEYEKLRQRHIVPSMLAIDALNRLYSTDIAPVALIRSLGLATFNSLEFLKSAVMKHASS